MLMAIMKRKKDDNDNHFAGLTNGLSGGNDFQDNVFDEDDDDDNDDSADKKKMTMLTLRA